MALIVAGQSPWRRDYWFGQVDSRPLSLLRIALGALLLKNALYLIPLAHLFYSDAGIMPRAQFWANPAQVGLGPFSLLNYAATSGQATLVFSVWAGIALALLVGYRTRLMSVLNYVLWLSLLHRNPFTLHGPDHVMIVLSFWLIFLPLNQSYSVDGWLARRQGQARPSATTYAFPLRVIQLQVALIYVLTSYYKGQGLFWRTGDALFYTLQRQSFLLPSGAWLGTTAPLWLLRLLTWSTLAIEASFALLVFAPLFQPWAKATGLLLAVLLHAGIAATMAIPDFSLVMWISYLLFFEPGWVDWLERQVCRWRQWPPPSSATRAPPAACPTRLTPGQIGITVLLGLILAATIWGGVAPAHNVWNSCPAAPPGLIQALNHQLHLASPWTMFAYHSTPRSGWLRIEGQFADGARRLLYTGVDPASGRAVWLWGPGARLRFFEQRLLWAFPETILRAWGSYYCRLYNHTPAPLPERQLRRVEIQRRYHWVHAPGAAPNPYTDDLLWRQQCF